MTSIWFRLSICHRLNLFYKVFINLRMVNFLIIFQMYSNRLVKVLLYLLISISFRFDFVNVRKWYFIKWAFIYLNLIFCSWLFILCKFFLRIVNIWRWIWLHEILALEITWKTISNILDFRWRYFLLCLFNWILALLLKKRSWRVLFNFLLF